VAFTSRKEKSAGSLKVAFLMSKVLNSSRKFVDQSAMGPSSLRTRKSLPSKEKRKQRTRKGNSRFSLEENGDKSH